MGERMPRYEAQSADCLHQTPLTTLLALGEAVVRAALEEDLAGGDPASAAFNRGETARALFLAKESGVAAGLPIAELVFRTLSPSIQFESLVDEGERIEPGDILAEIVGPISHLVEAERTALNFLQRMSGIATRTARYVREIATSGALLLDTRKTAPGLRALDKYAVRVGGGHNHRLNLSEIAMIKDTHIAGAGSIEQAVRAFRETGSQVPLEVEVRTLEELDAALALRPAPERLLLDNFDVDTLREAFNRVGGRSATEASGGINLETIAAIAQTGVDSISVGELTHSVRALDISMEVRAGSEGHSLAQRIAVARKQLGDRIIHLAHHYTRDIIVDQADIVGDSLALARAAADTEAEVIVFSGVHFMGETAAILSREDQHVVMPVPEAGCFLADCATLPAIEAAWETLAGFVETETVIPVTYVNSAASLKAFCGRNGGIVCTSTNASAILMWALEQGQRAFFFPDRHLGENTARLAGIADAKIYPWPATGEPDSASLRQARVITWPGVCNVHRRFRPEHVARVRSLHPDASVIVHPECDAAVVDLADFAGSTTQLIRFVKEAAPGSTVAVGTEARLVRRLQKQHANKTVLQLSEVPTFCRTMTQVTPIALLETLEGVIEGAVESREIRVDSETARWARAALDRMLEL